MLMASNQCGTNVNRRRANDRSHSPTEDEDNAFTVPGKKQEEKTVHGAVREEVLKSVGIVIGCFDGTESRVA